MRIGAGGGSPIPQLQTSWTRAEAACAARHKGDAYYELTAPQPTSDATAATAQPSPTSTASATGAQDSTSVTSDGLTPGFTLHL